MKATGSCTSFLKPGDFEVGGYAARARNLLADDADVVASMVVLPSFEAEYAVSLTHDRARGNKWLARYAVAKESIWGNSDDNRPIVEVQAIPLDSSLAERVVRVWEQVIAQPIPENPNLITFDGVTFVFSVNGNRANTWSPQCGIPQLAVKSGEALKDAITATLKDDQTNAFKKMAGLLDSIERQFSLPQQALKP